jgi:hypothetical protein
MTGEISINTPIPFLPSIQLQTPGDFICSNWKILRLSLGAIRQFNQFLRPEVWELWVTHVGPHLSAREKHSIWAMWEKVMAWRKWGPCCQIIRIFYILGLIRCLEIDACVCVPMYKYLACMRVHVYVYNIYEFIIGFV